MGGILADHIAHQNCVKRLARYFSRDSRYLYVGLRFGLEVDREVLASLYFVNLVVVNNRECTIVNNKMTRIGEKRHRPPSLQGSVEWCDVVARLRHSIKTQPPALAVDALYNLDPIQCGA